MPEMLRTQPLYGLAKGREKPVDVENRRINGFAVMTKGEALGHNVEIDDVTLDQLVKLGKDFGEKGVRSRFTHPNESNDGLGRYLGRSQAFVRDGDVVRADLQLSKMAFSSPHGDIGTWTMGMAEESPEHIGASVVITPKREYRLEKDGTPKRDKNGKVLPPLLRLEKLWAVDIVDEPAANPDGLFSLTDDRSPDAAARFATQYLDTLGESPAETVKRIQAFAAKYAAAKGLSMADEANAGAANTPPAVTPPVTPPPSADATAAAKAAQDQALAKARDEALSGERQRVREISELCQKYGCGALATSLIADGKSLEFAKDAVLLELGKRNPPVGGGETGGGNTAADQLGTKPDEKKNDPYAKYRAEYAANRAQFEESGHSEDDYIYSRCLDDEIKPPKPKPTEKK